MKKLKYLIIIFMLSILLVLSYSYISVVDNENEQLSNQIHIENIIEDEIYTNTTSLNDYEISNIPEFKEKPYVELNSNKPSFKEEEIVNVSYEEYNEQDSLGRCTLAEACLGKDLMPTEPREQISEVKPTGWQVAKYDDIDGVLLYNRCHLIAFSLAGENANENNLITGTRYMNTEGMEPFESKIVHYINKTNNHVMYRVTPIYEGDNLIASGVQMEAYSVEDEGEGINFNIYCYNVQPGFEIDYSNGNNRRVGDDILVKNYILNTNSMKFHKLSCPNIVDISDNNKEEYYGLREELVSKGYTPCGYCKP